MVASLRPESFSPKRSVVERRSIAAHSHASMVRAVKVNQAPVGIILSIILMILPGVSPCFAQNGSESFFEEPVSREYLVKAAYLLNFAKYTQWPEQAFHDEEAPLVIGVLGPNPFANVLERAAEKKEIHDRSIVVEYYPHLEGESPPPCHLLFFSKQLTAAEMKETLQVVDRAPILLSGDSRTFAVRGGITGFFIEENKVRFAINLESMKHHQLQISSKVLRLADTIAE